MQMEFQAVLPLIVLPAGMQLADPWPEHCLLAYLVGLLGLMGCPPASVRM